MKKQTLAQALLSTAGTIAKAIKPKKVRGRTDYTKLQKTCKEENLPVTFALRYFGGKGR